MIWWILLGIYSVFAYVCVCLMAKHDGDKYGWSRQFAVISGIAIAISPLVLPTLFLLRDDSLLWQRKSK